MTMLVTEASAPGGIEGTGDIVVVDHTTDNNLARFRFQLADVKMSAAEEDFELNGRKFRAGAFIIQNADGTKLDPVLRNLGLSAFATTAAPQVKTHDLDIPRIGYIHSWQRTQDEGWVRAALDTYGIPYTYFADQKLRDGNLRQKYDVLVFPHVGGAAQSQVNGIPKTGADPVPYKKSELTPNLGALDQSDDIRGGMGLEGLLELSKFVEQGGTLIVEGSTSAIFPEYGLTSGVSVENPSSLFVRGSIVRGILADKKSPLAYGFNEDSMPVYYNQEPVLAIAGGGGGFGGPGGGGGIPGVGMNITPMSTAPQQRISPLDPADAPRQRGGGAPAAGQAGFGGRGGGPGAPSPAVRPRVVLQFPANADDMLLSGVLVGGQALANRAQLVDAPLGKGHVVMFAIRPFWRWQTQGTFFFGFNAILNWNDLDAGRAEGPRPTTLFPN